jgi:hypothetical protein
MIDIDKLEALVKTVTSGAAAQKSADPVIRNMGRLEFDDACKQYLRATNPAAILTLIAEVRALRDAVKKQAHAAIAGMDSAKRTSTIQLQLAEQARAESSPEMLASERAMNAMLTEENEALREDAERWQSLVKWTVANAGEPSTSEFEFSYQPSGYNGGSFCWVEFGWRHPKWEHPTAEQMNAAIDAARAKEQS